MSQSRSNSQGTVHTLRSVATEPVDAEAVSMIEILQEHLVLARAGKLRSLAVVSTGHPVSRETVLPGAVLARVGASHLRVGTFQYAAVHGDVGLVRLAVMAGCAATAVYLLVRAAAGAQYLSRRPLTPADNAW